jgi:hypothetical protein
VGGNRLSGYAACFVQVDALSELPQPPLDLVEPPWQEPDEQPDESELPPHELLLPQPELPQDVPSLMHVAPQGLQLANQEQRACQLHAVCWPPQELLLVEQDCRLHEFEFVVHEVPWLGAQLVD